VLAYYSQRIYGESFEQNLPEKSSWGTYGSRFSVRGNGCSSAVWRGPGYLIWAGVPLCARADAVFSANLDSATTFHGQKSMKVREAGQHQRRRQGNGQHLTSNFTPFLV
jgi:hypothetical protein